MNIGKGGDKIEDDEKILSTSMIEKGRKGLDWKRFGQDRAEQDPLTFAR